MWLVAAGVVGTLIWRKMSEPKPAREVPPVSADAGVTADAAVVHDAPSEPVVDAPVAIDAPPRDPLYTVTEALDDVRAAPLEYIGRGVAFGNFSINACAYRNTRVIVIYTYCTGKEQPALGLVVLSPTRGRVSIYVEADAGISTLVRSQYMTFRIEVQPPMAENALSLAYTFDELVFWDGRRTNAHEAACWIGDGTPDCSGDLDPLLDAWAEPAKAFVDEPSESWYTLVKDLRKRTVRDSRR